MIKQKIKLINFVLINNFSKILSINLIKKNKIKKKKNKINQKILIYLLNLILLDLNFYQKMVSITIMNLYNKIINIIPILFYKNINHKMTFLNLIN